jgi:hypothetical protein
MTCWGHPDFISQPIRHVLWFINKPVLLLVCLQLAGVQNVAGQGYWTIPKSKHTRPHCCGGHNLSCIGSSSSSSIITHLSCPGALSSMAGCPAPTWSGQPPANTNKQKQQQTRSRSGSLHELHPSRSCS